MKYKVTSVVMDRKSRKRVRERQEFIDTETNPHFSLAQHYIGGAPQFIEMVYEEAWRDHREYTIKVIDIQEA